MAKNMSIFWYVGSELPWSIIGLKVITRNGKVFTDHGSFSHLKRERALANPGLQKGWAISLRSFFLEFLLKTYVGVPPPRGGALPALENPGSATVTDGSQPQGLVPVSPVYIYMYTNILCSSCLIHDTEIITTHHVWCYIYCYIKLWLQYLKLIEFSAHCSRRWYWVGDI